MANWYLVADGEAHRLTHDQAVLLQTADDDNDEADALYHDLTGAQRYDGACGRDYIITQADSDEHAIDLAILYDHGEAALDNVTCPDCGETHVTAYSTVSDPVVRHAAAELIAAADHVAGVSGDCNCDLCRGGLNTVRQIAGFYPPGWWHETPEQRSEAVEVAKRAVGEED